MGVRREGRARPRLFSFLGLPFSLFIFPRFPLSLSLFGRVLEGSVVWVRKGIYVVPRKLATQYCIWPSGNRAVKSLNTARVTKACDLRFGNSQSQRTTFDSGQHFWAAASALHHERLVFSVHCLVDKPYRRF